MKQKIIVAASILAFSAAPGIAFAQESVFDPTVYAGLLSLAKSFTSLFTSNMGVLSDVGSKLASSITGNGNQDRIAAAALAQQTEMNKAVSSTELPIDPCNTTGSNYLAATVATTYAGANALRHGGGGQPASDRALDNAVNGVAPPKEISQQASSAIHTDKYCNALETAIGFANCQSSQMPDGDADASSLFDGAGLVGKSPDMTFSPAQVEAGRAYIRLSTDPDPPQELTKSEEASTIGKMYFGMQKAYQAAMSSSSFALNRLLALHAPAPGTAQMISDIIGSNSSAAQYYNSTRSAYSAANNVMSLAEFEDFNVGRRSRNPYWYLDMGAVADDTKLHREEVFELADLNEMLYQIKLNGDQTNLLLAEMVANSTRKERPELESMFSRVKAATAK